MQKNTIGELVLIVYYDMPIDTHTKEILLFFSKYFRDAFLPIKY